MKKYPENSLRESPANIFMRQSRVAALSPTPRHSPTGISNLLTGLWLRGTPFAYSFCNLDLPPATAYSQWDRVFSVFGPRRASK